MNNNADAIFYQTAKFIVIAALNDILSHVKYVFLLVCYYHF